MTHQDGQELTALYVLDALSGADRESFEAHLRTCTECQREVASLRSVATGLLQAVPERVPPPDLRRRVLSISAAQGDTRARTTAFRTSNALRWLATAAALLVAVAAILVSGRTASRARSAEAAAQRAREEATAVQTQLAEAQRRLTEATARLAVLTAPDAVRVELAGQTPAPTAVARAYWSRSRGLVFTASHLPPAPPQRTYQLWVVTAQGPISAGLLQADQAGDASAVFNTPSDIPPPVAMAVTLEPEGGVPAPTGDKYLVGVPPR